MQISDLNPHIRYARSHKAIFSTGNKTSKCYDCRVFFFYNTEGSAVINDTEYNICHNTAIYLPPESEYRFSINFTDIGKIIVLNFDLINDFCHIKTSLHTDTKDNFDKSRVPKYPLPKELSAPIVKIIPHIGKNLTKCTENFIIRDSLYRESSSSILKMWLLEIIKESSKSAHSKLCEDILSHVHKNYSNPSLTNESIAESFYHHPYYLSRLIKQETGKTLHQYIIYYRLQIAKDYLITTQLDMSEIADLCGFCSSAYFAELFRQRTGMTPKEYRALQLNTEI